MTHEEVYYTIKQLVEFYNLYDRNLKKQLWEWLLRVWGNSGRNIKLDEAEMIKMGSLTKILDLVFQPEGVGRGCG